MLKMLRELNREKTKIQAKSAITKSPTFQIVRSRCWRANDFDWRLESRVRGFITPYYTLMTSVPIYFASASGILMEPSACWQFSIRETRMRGVGMAVEFNEWA